MLLCARHSTVGRHVAALEHSTRKQDYLTAFVRDSPNPEYRNGLSEHVTRHCTEPTITDTQLNADS